MNVTSCVTIYTNLNQKKRVLKRDDMFEGAYYTENSRIRRHA